jgi:phosphatidylserine decarboxylase
MFKSLLARLQIVLPTLLLTRIAGLVAGSRIVWLKNTMIRCFSKAYRINWEEIEADSASEFASFNEFFSRPLQTDARSFQAAPGKLLSPCDGSIGASGQIATNQQLLQAKGISYPLQHLLACAADETECLLGYAYHTVYLAPHNYHRVHMPLEGTLQQCQHVPGRLFSVAPASTNALPGLFCRNERVVCWFQDEQQRPWVMVLVGAMLVGSIATVWHGRYQHRSQPASDAKSTQAAVHLPQGAEMGRFLMGSTVILITPDTATTALTVGDTVSLYQPLTAA